MPRGVHRLRVVVALSPLVLTSACGGDPGAPGPVDEEACPADAEPTRTVSCVLDFTPGDGAGFGMDAYPDIVYGPPHGGASSSGSLDVLSLGKGGEIALGFGGNTIVNGPGPDFIVFENPFIIGGDPEKVFKELGEVSVSADGETWTTFSCQADAYPYEGCAGWRPVLGTPDSGDGIYNPEVAGGDVFDLEALGIDEVRFVRIKDISNFGAADTAGFDLDAVAIVHPSR
ncbi:putative lipoprotein [Chondromyces apiculatus DSM 436]|uniref:Putative lipoprotein n=1 Tax=Chondromyces apiculatus DSM 436 TaxID=1192034 RepID=A0A017THH0_9BACT|nr:putative lipoprotein [Chondromyces apiculatus DSM 436]